MLTTKRTLPDQGSTWHSGCWIAAMLGTFFCRHMFNLYKGGLGNPQIPEKLKRRKWKQLAAAIRPVTPPRLPGFLLTVALVVSAIALAASVSIFLRRGSPSVARIPAEGGPMASIPEKSIAVLPFENRSEDKANAYFADGIQDEILT